ncbi:hypothetical protein PG994_006066 [Apiospora phragmitis]|uniref:Uncharacterized protein n=1 Tax=Apiospora phragmitis TaxID=2905665 RepID=A0ABR1VE04_9PEZI
MTYSAEGTVVEGSPVRRVGFATCISPAPVETNEHINLYKTLGSAHSPGQPIDDGYSLELKSGMDSTLTTVGEHTNDYIQFHYGSTSWTSFDTKGDASCKLVGDNWDKNGPKGCPNAMAVSYCLAGAEAGGHLQSLAGSA